MIASSSTVRPCSTRSGRTDSWTILCSRTQCTRRYGARSRWRRGSWTRSCAASLALVERNSGATNQHRRMCGSLRIERRGLADRRRCVLFLPVLRRCATPRSGPAVGKEPRMGGRHQTACSRRSAGVSRPAESGCAVGRTARRARGDRSENGIPVVICGQSHSRTRFFSASFLTLRACYALLNPALTSRSATAANQCQPSRVVVNRS